MAKSDAARLTKLILLVDGENVSGAYAKGILDQVEKLGTLIEGRVYGDAANSKMLAWQRSSDARHLKKIHVERISDTKDVADFRMIVEAMDMLHTRQVDAFCIASGDGGFTALAQRILGASISLYGFGEKSRTADRFRKLCDQFFFCEELASVTSGHPSPADVPTSQRKNAEKKKSKRTSTISNEEHPIPLPKLMAAIDEAAEGKERWAHLQKVGHRLASAGYSPRKQRYKLPSLVLRYPKTIEVEKRGNVTYIRRRQ